VNAKRKSKSPSRARRRATSASKNAKQAAGAKSASPETVAPDRPPLPPPPRPRKKLAEAMRNTGIDEWKFAAVLNSQVDRLEKAGEEKLLLEVLKEVGKTLDPAKRAASSLDPVPVNLLHNVPRPEREGGEE
jgi:hypothetical protein